MAESHQRMTNNNGRNGSVHPLQQNYDIPEIASYLQELKREIDNTIRVLEVTGGSVEIKGMKSFVWGSKSLQCLREIISTAKNVLPGDKTAQSAGICSILEHRILPLWPRGWMTFGQLINRISRLQAMNADQSIPSTVDATAQPVIQEAAVSTEPAIASNTTTVNENSTSEIGNQSNVARGSLSPPIHVSGSAKTSVSSVPSTQSVLGGKLPISSDATKKKIQNKGLSITERSVSSVNQTPMSPSKQKNKQPSSGFVKCSYCVKTFANSRNYRFHLSCVHSPKIHKCPQCGSMHVSVNAMKCHIYERHTRYAMHKKNLASAGSSVSCDESALASDSTGNKVG